MHKAQLVTAVASRQAAVVHMMKEFELRQAGGRGRGLFAWWRRKRFALQVTSTLSRGIAMDHGTLLCLFVLSVRRPPLFGIRFLVLATKALRFRIESPVPIWRLTAAAECGRGGAWSPGTA